MFSGKCKETWNFVKFQGKEFEWSRLSSLCNRMGQRNELSVFGNVGERRGMNFLKMRAKGRSQRKKFPVNISGCVKCKWCFLKNTGNLKIQEVSEKGMCTISLILTLDQNGPNNSLRCPRLETLGKGKEWVSWGGEPKVEWKSFQWTWLQFYVAQMIFLKNLSRKNYF